METNTPSYISSASLHSSATADESGILSSLANAPKFWGLAVGSGVVGLANTFIGYGNMLLPKESKVPEINYDRWLQEHDRDLGRYYRDNTRDIDTWGFVATSLVPGTLGVRALRGAQVATNLGQKAVTTASSSGMVGKGMQWGTGLLVPRTEAYMAAAGKSLAQTTGSFKYLQKDVLKAVGSKFHQNFLEAAAFEVAAMAAMNQSPFFDDMENSDIVWNMGVGLLLGGTIGGVLSSAGVRGAVTRTATRLDADGIAASTRNHMPATAPNNVSLSYKYRDKAAVEQYIFGGGKGATEELVNKNLATARSTIQGIDNEARTSIRAMTLDAGDEVGNKFADTIQAMDSTRAMQLTLGADNFARVGTVPKVKVPVSPGSTRMKPGPDMENGWTFYRMFGDGEYKAGDAANLPKAMPLADTLPQRNAKQTIKEAVDAKVAQHRHRLDTPGFDVSKIKALSLEAVQTRYIHAATKGFKFNTKKPIRISQGDFPVMENLREQMLNGLQPGAGVKILNSKGQPVRDLQSVRDLEEYIIEAKEAAKGAMVEAKVDYSEIAERLNMSPGQVTGLAVPKSGDAVENYFYHQSLGKGSYYEPQYMAIKGAPDVGKMLHELEGDVELAFAHYRAVYQQTADNAVANAAAFYDSPALREVIDTFPEADLINQVVLDSSRLGPGGGALTFMNGEYLSPGAVMQGVGSLKARLDSLAQGRIDELMKPVSDALKGNTAAAVEVQTVSELVSNSGEIYYYQNNMLRSRRLVEWEAALESNPNAKAPEFPNGIQAEIPINRPEARNFIAKHIELNGERVQGAKNMRAAQGIESHLDPLAFYPPKPDPRKFNNFAIVVDRSLTGQGSHKMIHAATQRELEAMVARVHSEFGDKYRIVSKADSKDYFESIGGYDNSKVIQDPYIDSSLASRGINSQFFPITDPEQIADNFVVWHKQQSRMFNADLVATKYDSAFKELESKGREFSRLESSTYTSLGQLATEAKDNPYINYIKTALNVSREADYPILSFINNSTEAVVSRLWNRAQAVWDSARGKVDETTLATINKVFQEHGFKTAVYDTSMNLLANHPAGKDHLSRFVRSANSLLATTILRLDWLNAVNNKLGSIVLTSAELHSLIRGIKSANPEVAGKLAQLSEVIIPGTTDSILAPTKLIVNALENFLKRPELIESYRNRGLLTDSLTAARGLVDDLSLTGIETPGQLEAKIRSAIEKAKQLQDTNRSSKYASTVLNPLRLNQFTEDLNRFIAADIARQIGEVAVEAGIISTREVHMIQNTFVNRTQVNLNRSQRPMAFQGPVGMALSLFQSYQFNMLQQMFRYVQPGQRKTAAMLMGMQSSMYGLNGVPGFQALNEYVIGQAAGNSEHEDMYTNIFRAAGDVAPWILYGTPSNVLNVNMYTRGDLTPQHPTVLPSSPLDFPVISATGRFFGNLKDVASNLSNGTGVWNSIVAGLEHNSVNRPLAGLAATMRGLSTGRAYSTDRGGNFLSSNDLMSLTTLGRIAGGRPLDESIARDNMWRTSVYRRADAEKRKSLGEMVARRTAAGDQVAYWSVMEEYIKLGGKQAGFNRWFMNQQTRGTVSQAELARQSVSDPLAHRLQTIMGGMDDDLFSQ